MGKTTIEWTEYTWQPITGCSVVSPGCTNCYAMKLAGTRLKHHESRVGLTKPSKAGPVWTGEVRFNEGWLDQPLRWKRPRLIFVCAHGDLFAEGVPDEWIDKVFAVMSLAPQHTFQVLTKRPERMRQYLKPFDQRRIDALGMELHKLGYRGPLESLKWPLPNVWLGVSVEDQERADERIPILLDTPAAVRWISAEPLLGPINLNAIHQVSDDGLTQSWESALNGKRFSAYGGPEGNGGDVEGFPKLDWVVAGGESGQGARPMHPAWVRSLRDQCATAGTPFHFKQWGEFSYEETMTAVYTDGRVVPTADQPMKKTLVGKEHAGRLLDGITHDGWPHAAGRN